MRHTSGTADTAAGTPRGIPRGTATTPCAARVAPSRDDPLDVVVLLAPDRPGAYALLFEAIVQVALHDRTAVLVVFGHAVDDDTRRCAYASGADFCVVEPSSADLFGHIERARSEHRSKSPSASTGATRPRARS
jgi:hypothetical protein